MTSELLRFIRLQKRLSQRDFAKKVGVSKALVAMIEADERKVTRSTRDKVLRAFGYTDADLIRIEGLHEAIREEIA